MVNLTRRSVAKLHEWRVRRTIQKSDLKEQLKTQKGRSALEALQKQLKKRGLRVPETCSAMISPELANRHAPKSSIRSAAERDGRGLDADRLSELRAGEEKGRPVPVTAPLPAGQIMSCRTGSARGARFESARTCTIPRAARSPLFLSCFCSASSALRPFWVFSCSLRSDF